VTAAAADTAVDPHHRRIGPFSRLLPQNVDVAEVPARPSTGDNIASCSVTLMPWSPFPCTYNTAAFSGVEGQNKTNWCFDQHTIPQEPGFDYARDLVTDGYSNLYHGWMPDTPCGHSSSSGSSSGSEAGRAPGYGKHFAKVLLTLTFRVAAGRQFDRTYWFQIGRAVVSIGTCHRPFLWRVQKVDAETAGPSDAEGPAAGRQT
jgi:hypothetical protein